jgi:hypothetical protein
MAVIVLEKYHTSSSRYPAEAVRRIKDLDFSERRKGTFQPISQLLCPQYMFGRMAMPTSCPLEGIGTDARLIKSHSHADCALIRKGLLSATIPARILARWMVVPHLFE